MSSPGWIARAAAVLCLSLLAGLGALGCGGIKEDPILRLSAEEALAQGKAQMEKGNHRRARDYLSHAFDVAPNSAEGREALLLVADSHFLQGGTSNFIKAEAKYRDFLNRFPTSQRADYVQFHIARSLARRMEKPDRDQTVTRKALEELELFLRLYPSSPHAEEARQEIQRVRDNLAAHEFHVAYFYFRFGLAGAAATRLEHLLAQYPDYGERERSLYILGSAYTEAKQVEEARETFRKLAEEYPDSRYLDRIPEKKLGRAAEEAEKLAADAAADPEAEEEGEVQDEG